MVQEFHQGALLVLDAAAEAATAILKRPHHSESSTPCRPTSKRQRTNGESESTVPIPASLSSKFYGILKACAWHLWEEALHTCVPENQARRIMAQTWGSSNVNNLSLQQDVYEKLSLHTVETATQFTDKSSQDSPSLLQEKFHSKPQYPPKPPPPPEEKGPHCPLCHSCGTPSLHTTTCPIATLKRLSTHKHSRRRRNPKLPPPTMLSHQKRLTYKSLAGILEGILRQDEPMSSVWPEISGAPRPLALLAHYLYKEICNQQHSNEWKWYASNGFPHRTGAFVCPRIPTNLFDYEDDSSVESKLSSPPPPLPWRTPDYAVVAGCTIWILEWNTLWRALFQSTSPSKTMAQGLKCRSCLSGTLHCQDWDRLIPLFGDCGEKLSWIVSILYRCDHCRVEIRGTCPQFLASLPLSLRRMHPSSVSWVQPGGRFQVTRSLAQRLQTTFQADQSKNGAHHRLQFALQAQYDGLYAMEEMEYALGQVEEGSGSHESGNDFPSFRGWFGNLNVPTAMELEQLYQYAKGA